MAPNSSPGVADRVTERRRAVALARHYREFEGLSIVQIAHRVGRSPATVKAYFYDPTGEKARAVKARYQGVCRGCGAYMQPRNGKGDAYAYCKTCHPGAIERRWTRTRVLAAMREWRLRHGRLPTSYDWSRTHARRRGGDALKRLREGDWPSASVVTSVLGSWAAARAQAEWDRGRNGHGRAETSTSSAAAGQQTAGGHAIRAKRSNAVGLGERWPRRRRVKECMPAEGIPEPKKSGAGKRQYGTSSVFEKRNAWYGQWLSETGQ